MTLDDIRRHMSGGGFSDDNMEEALRTLPVQMLIAASAKDLARFIMAYDDRIKSHFRSGMESGRR